MSARNFSKSKTGTVLLPLVIVVVALTVIPLVAYLISRLTTQIGVAPNAKNPRSNALFPTGIHLSGTPYSTVAPEPILEADTKSGCVLSLRFDQNDAPVQSLKTDAQTTLMSIRNDILGGSRAQALLDQILQSGSAQTAAADIRDLLSKRTATTISPAPTSRFEKFQVGDSPNFCFGDSSQRHSRLGSFFYEVNPVFTTQFTRLGPGEISMPFVIYRVTPTRTIEYAWMIITREK